MIQLNRTSNLTQTAMEDVKIKIVGVGGAGSNALDRIVLDGIGGAEIVAIDSHVQSLTSSVVTEKVQLGRNATRGLGAGGDPEVGLAAGEEAADEIRQALAGAQMIFICTGLGGGTGSGAAPLVANIAKEHGALTVVFATMPFAFEGRRRRAQAEEALTALQDAADAVVCFENDKMGDAVPLQAGVHEAFANADQTLSQSVRAICELFTRPGIIHIGFDDLVTALRNNNARCLFGYGESEGDNRAHESLAIALRNPLMDKGRMLNDAHNLLVNVVGGPGMTLNEVQILMEELGRHIGDDTRVLFGTAVDPRLGQRMSVTIISSTALGETVGIGLPVRTAPVPRISPPIKTESEHPEEKPKSKRTPDKEKSQPVESAVVNEKPEAATEVSAPKPQPVAQKPPKITQTFQETSSAAAVAAAPKTPQQESLPFETLNRGRFEKSEPTIVNGQDLDVPTFMRRNVKIK